MFHVIIFSDGFHDQNKVNYCATEDTAVVSNWVLDIVHCFSILLPTVL
jgi:hypothetical protein